MFGCDDVSVGWPDVGMAGILFGSVVAMFWIFWSKL